MTQATADTWRVDIFVGEVDGRSTATATLHAHARTDLSAQGTARLSPRDHDVPEIGYELATARALSALAHELLMAAADDISGVTHETVLPEDLVEGP
ncbi:DUF1876 domain-containing protein [Nocardioides sp. GXQ0305]|uniref:DUF1876 domain-containing protein n=1 Tax=Nocardioides sp. GXQ0305 TaxID=3423912 RepID=UPI003D7DEA2B